MLTIQLIYFDCKKVLHPKKSKVKPELEMCYHSRLIRSSLLKIHYLKHSVNKKIEIHAKHPYAM
jgi:hypothetical protein